MRRIRPEARQRGLTLIEMIIAMVITGIVVALALFFTLPLQQAVDVSVRAELTDIAHNSLQRIGRDVRLALPNSVRTDGSTLEFIPLRTGGRYRVQGSGACTGVSDDHLAFEATDGCFKSLGTILNAAEVTNNDYLVLNNYGTGFALQDQDAYSGGNRRKLTAAIAAQQRVEYNHAGTAFTRNRHDSAGRRFFIAGTPVAYQCAGGTLTRYQNYTNGDNGFTAGANPPTTFTGGSAALLATNVVDCNFDYAANVAPMVGLLTMTLTLRRSVSTGTETVRLYHSVHVNNVP